MAKSSGNKIGVVPATLMVAGNMMGSGVFMLPANLAGIGGVAIIGWLITCVGAIALALTFSKLASIDPAAGGPYAYTKHAFGNYMGFQSNLIYWLANVIGNVGLATAGLGYLSSLIPALKDPAVLAIAQVCVIWLFTFINMIGPKLTSRVQSVTTIITLIPIVGIALLGWFWFSPQTYMEGWNVTGKSTMDAVGMTLNFTLWAFIGVESASVSAGVVENPKKNVPIATIGGVILAAICYVLASTAIMGMIPNKELVASSAPFADAAKVALGPIAGEIVAVCAAVGCLGSLGGWTLIVGQSAKAASDDGLFPRLFSRTNKKDVPSLGLMVVAIIMSVIVIATASPSASQQFGKIASIAVILTLLPYIYSCVALRVLGKGKMSTKSYNLYIVISLIAAVYSLAALVTSNGDETRWSLIFVVATIILYETVLGRKKAADGAVDPSKLRSPKWVRIVTVVVLIATLVITFGLTVGQKDLKAWELKHRSNITGIESVIDKIDGADKKDSSSSTSSTTSTDSTTATTSSTTATTAASN